MNTFVEHINNFFGLFLERVATKHGIDHQLIYQEWIEYSGQQKDILKHEPEKKVIATPTSPTLETPTLEITNETLSLTKTSTSKQCNYVYISGKNSGSRCTISTKNDCGLCSKHIKNKVKKLQTSEVETTGEPKQVEKDEKKDEDSSGGKNKEKEKVKYKTNAGEVKNKVDSIVRFSELKVRDVEAILKELQEPPTDSIPKGEQNDNVVRNEMRSKGGSSTAENEHADSDLDEEI